MEKQHKGKPAVSVHKLKFSEAFDCSEPDASHFVALNYAVNWMKGKVVLNIGCWTGNFEVVASPLARRMISIEIDSTAIRIARKANSSGDFVNADLFHLPFKDGLFDTVLIFAVIEHIGDREAAALSEMRRVLKPGGNLVLSTPHSQWLYNLMDVAHWLVDHRHFGSERMKTLLLQSGFRIVRFDILGRTLSTLSTPFFYLGKYLFGVNIYRNKFFKQLFIKDHSMPGYRDIYLVAERDG